VKCEGTRTPVKPASLTPPDFHRDGREKTACTRDFKESSSGRRGRQFRQVDVGLSHTCGVTTGSRAFCWGSNDYGQLGDGTTTQRLRPVAGAGGLTFRHVSVGTGHYPFTCGVTATNRAYCWGRNNYGQLGDSTTAARRVRPSQPSGGTWLGCGDSRWYAPRQADVKPLSQTRSELAYRTAIGGWCAASPWGATQGGICASKWPHGVTEPVSPQPRCRP